MKKFFATLAVFVMLVIAGSAFAGPIDWMADKLGYVPEAQLVAAQVETAKAVAAAKEATTAANNAADIAGKATTYGIFMTALLGGLAIFRKKIAKKILAEKPAKAEPKEV
ncbi:MAG TPA: hypothetical protein PKG96_06420 [Bacilli bacterium]|nr:hypothetical protein [Bacilli bacterium]